MTQNIQKHKKLLQTSHAARQCRGSLIFNKHSYRDHKVL